ncbi:MAG: response regulator transcription factor [Clostridia bacterium]|nr:response regulator transcription factor [Clostridia bacterium]MDD4386263.1 response regulator transcription factor [Clostridia bacterium]
MMKILIVDDEPRIRQVVKEYGIVNNYQIDEAGDGIEAIEKCKMVKYDLVILDIMMPKMDGIEAAKNIKEYNKNISIIMLSAKGEEYDKLLGFGIGADDYVTKPFSPKELMARINAILNRNNVKHKMYTFDGLNIDMTSREVYVDDSIVKLSPKEYDLLFYLVINKNIALSRENLLINVWGYDFFGDDRTVDTHIKTLRCNLDKYRDFIVTLRGMGYKFEYKA